MYYYFVGDTRVATVYGKVKGSETDWRFCLMDNQFNSASSLSEAEDVIYNNFHSAERKYMDDLVVSR